MLPCGLELPEYCEPETICFKTYALSILCYVVLSGAGVSPAGRRGRLAGRPQGALVMTDTLWIFCSCVGQTHIVFFLLVPTQSGDSEWLQVPVNYVERMEDEDEVAATPVTAPPAASEQVCAVTSWSDAHTLCCIAVTESQLGG